MTTRDEIRTWLDRGRALNATHMIVACDTFSYEDYPAYVKVGEDVRARVDELQNPNEMSQVREVYSYALDLETQLHEVNAWHVE